MGEGFQWRKLIPEVFRGGSFLSFVSQQVSPGAGAGTWALPGWKEPGATRSPGGWSGSGPNLQGDLGPDFSPLWVSVSPQE